MSARRALALLVAGALLTAGAGCGTAKDDGSSDPERSRITVPTASTTVLPTDSAAATALALSESLFVQAPAVMLAAADNAAGRQDAAGLAEEQGVPLLLLPAAGADAAVDAAAVQAELRRLDPTVVMAFDDTAAGWAEADAGVPVRAPGEPLPATDPPEPLPSVLVVTGEETDPAVLATARAVGARVLPLADPDPRADPAAIEALAGERIGHVLVLGEQFGSGELLRDRLTVAATGVELPGGGQLALPGRRMIALYGHPGAPELGVLGEQPVDPAVQRVRELAGEYESLVEEPVVPVFEIITTVASGTPGPEGDYSLRTSIDKLRPWVAAAAEAGIYVVLDLQPGRTDFLTQARAYEELLVEPHVGLALDPEWRLTPDQVHLEQIGSVAATEVNEVADWLADLTREHRLPQKLLVLHQFQLAMIGDRQQLNTDHDELAVLIHADGHGTTGQKLETWRTLRDDPPPGVWWGWKNFYDEDRPMLSPEQTVEVEPSPVFISYQ